MEESVSAEVFARWFVVSAKAIYARHRRRLIAESGGRFELIANNLIDDFCVMRRQVLEPIVPCQARQALRTARPA